MISRRPPRAVALLIVLCMLAVGGIASAQSVTHDSHHAHHQKATHGTVLCSWMCAAGQAVEGVAAPVSVSLIPLEIAPQPGVSPIAALAATSRTTRAPPVL